MTQIGTTRERAAYREALVRVNAAPTFDSFCLALLELMRTPRIAVFCERNGRTVWRRAHDTRSYVIDFVGSYTYRKFTRNGQDYIKIQWGEINPQPAVKATLYQEFGRCSFDGSLLQLCDGQLFLLNYSDSEREYCRFMIGD